MKFDFLVLSWYDVVFSLMFVAGSYGLLRYWKLDLSQSLIIGSVRAFLQLTIMGYVLTYFFRQNNWVFMILLLLIMISIASFEGTRRQDIHIKNMFLIFLGTMILTTFVILASILVFIMEVKPWYFPYAMIPIAGMIIGNATNSTSLSINRFVGELRHRQDEIETLLSLGAPPREAIIDAYRDSLKAALIPNINGMMMVGLVQIPGVMTGQILSGIDPLVAVKYQIIIMYMWTATATLANVIILSIIYRGFFNERWQFKKQMLSQGNKLKKIKSTSK
jgi:putative ABC transport system permease protein